VRVCDGTTVLMSDTVANQAEYPQHKWLIKINYTKQEQQLS
jgi:hypothetical protein